MSPLGHCVDPNNISYGMKVPTDSLSADVKRQCLRHTSPVNYTSLHVDLSNETSPPGPLTVSNITNAASFLADDPISYKDSSINTSHLATSNTLNPPADDLATNQYPPDEESPLGAWYVLNAGASCFNPLNDASLLGI